MQSDELETVSNCGRILSRFGTGIVSMVFSRIRVEGSPLLPTLRTVEMPLGPSQR